MTYIDTLLSLLLFEICRICSRKYKIVKVSNIAPDETSLVKGRAYGIQMNNMLVDGADQD